MHEGVKALVGVFLPFVGEVEGEHGGCELGMPQVTLDETGMHASFEQMGGVGMPEGISTLLIIRRSSAFATTTIPSLVRPSKSSGGYDGRPQRVWSSNSRMALSWRFPRGCSIPSRATSCTMRLRHV